MCLLSVTVYHISQVNKSVQHERARDLLKFQTIRKVFALNRTIQGCDIFYANAEGTIAFIISSTTKEEIIHTFQAC